MSYVGNLVFFSGFLVGAIIFYKLLSFTILVIILVRKIILNKVDYFMAILAGIIAGICTLIIIYKGV